MARSMGLGRGPLGGASASGSGVGAWRLGLARPSPRLGCKGIGAKLRERYPYYSVSLRWLAAGRFFAHPFNRPCKIIAITSYGLTNVKTP